MEVHTKKTKKGSFNTACDFFSKEKHDFCLMKSVWLSSILQGVPTSFGCENLKNTKLEFVKNFIKLKWDLNYLARMHVNKRFDHFDDCFAKFLTKTCWDTWYVPKKIEAMISKTSKIWWFCWGKALWRGFTHSLLENHPKCPKCLIWVLAFFANFT